MRSWRSRLIRFRIAPSMVGSSVFFEARNKIAVKGCNIRYQINISLRSQHWYIHTCFFILSLKMSNMQAFSSPDLASLATCNGQNSSLEGVASNVMVLLKLLQEQNKATIDGNNGRSTQRMAGMLAILEDIRNRIEKAQSSFGKKREAELRRCNTELRRSNIPPPGVRSPDAEGDEKARLRKELVANVSAKRNLQVMCSSLGKEKEIMAVELARKVGQVQGLEELINDLKAQNVSLLENVQTCAAEHKDRKSPGSQRVLESTGNNAAALQERNRTLSKQLLKAWIESLEYWRPHQIRIHLPFIGHPLLGDPLYDSGGKPKCFDAELTDGDHAQDGGYQRPTNPVRGDCGYHLHAHHVELAHPITDMAMKIFAPLPPLLQ